MYYIVIVKSEDSKHTCAEATGCHADCQDMNLREMAAPPGQFIALQAFNVIRW